MVKKLNTKIQFVAHH